MQLKVIPGFFMIMLVLLGCSNLSPYKKMTDYINNQKNKISQTIQVGDVKVSTKWLPNKYLKRQVTTNNQPEINRRNNSEYGDSSIADDYCYFNVKFEKAKIEKLANEKVLYLSFDLGNDFTLLCEGDSLNAVICQKIENGISGCYEYIVAFDNSHNKTRKKDFTLYYKDKLFGIGTIAFVFSQKDIQKIPAI